MYDALSQPLVGHLDAYFFEVADQVRTLLGYAFGTASDFNLAMSGTGSSGMEACVANLAEPEEKFAVLSNGYFAERIAEMARRQGARVVKFEAEWATPFDHQAVREFIRKEQPRVVAFVQAETSTGMYNEAKPIAEAAHEAGAVVLADCVTSLGGMPVAVDENGIDIAYSCSQKGLSCPPGLAPVTVGERALERVRSRKSQVHTWYLDLLLTMDSYFKGHRYHHTASATLFYALREALALVAEEGLEARFARHRRNHLAFVAGVEAMGLSMQVAEGHRLWTLNTPRVPAGVDDAKVRAWLLQERDIEIAGGLGPLAGKVFRIGLMGAGSEAANVLMVLDALAAALRQQGFTPAADPVAAAEKSLAAQA